MKTILFVLCLAASAMSQEKDRGPFTVGSATASVGERVSGLIPVEAGVDLGSDIPVVVVNGRHPGPVLAIMAGSHGTEYASIVAAQQLISLLNPEEISGVVIVVPLINIPSFMQKVPHLNPIDGKNLNRVYPGNLKGTQSERIAYYITSQILERADHVIDMHGGDLDENLRPNTIWTKTANEKQDAISREMALAFGLDTIIISNDRPRDPMHSLYLENTATTRGKPSITVEAGYAGTVDADDVSSLVTGCLSVMRYLKMLPHPATKVEHPVWIDHVLTVTAQDSGVFYPLVKKGTYAEKGMKLGYITDVFGHTIYESRATGSGVVLYICAVPSMKKGDTIAHIGTIAPPAAGAAGEEPK